jgi:hypothetical protein
VAPVIATLPSPLLGATPTVLGKLQARLALIEVHKKEFVHVPNRPIDLQDVFGREFPADTTYMSTVHWNSDPTLGFPNAPYLVEVAQRNIPLEGHGHRIDELKSSGGSGTIWSLLGSIRGPSGVLFLAAKISAAPATEIFATDMFGEEIPETRQKANAPQGTVFYGPDIYGLRTTGRADLKEVYIFALGAEENIEMELKARVAPPFASVAAYQNQFYCGRSYNAKRAAEVRVKADAFVRASVRAPANGELDIAVHRADPLGYSLGLLNQDFVKQSEANIGNLMGSDTWSYKVPNPGNGTIEVHPAQLWQFLALTGPVEAATLGHAVTIPVKGQFPDLENPSNVYEFVAKNLTLPYALVRVTGSHMRDKAVVTSQQYARLAPMGAVGPVTAMQRKAQIPASLDGPATADVELRLPRSQRFYAHFVARVAANGSEQLEKVLPAAKLPKVYWADSNSADRTSTGDPQFSIGPVNLPLDVQSILTVKDYARDVFGRWPEPAKVDCRLSPWPVQTPALLSAVVRYREDGIAELTTKLGWDWTLRSPSEIRLGLALGPVGGGATENVKPSDKVNLPGRSMDLKVQFKADGGPFLVSSPLPVPPGFTVALAALPPPDSNDGPLHLPDGSRDVRMYELRIPIGTFDQVFAAADIWGIGIAVDALEKVSPSRRSDFRRLSSEAADPRPPVLKSQGIRLCWTSRPDGANRARIRLSAPSSDLGKPGGRIGGYRAWRADESCVLDLLVAAHFTETKKGEAAFAGIRDQRDMTVRLLQIQGLLNPHLADPAFQRAFVNLFEVVDTAVVGGDFELSLKASNTGFVFVMFSAISTTGIESDKLNLSNLCAVAVPHTSKLNPPTLRILRNDVTNTLEPAGLCLAIAGVDANIASDDVRIFWDARALVTDPNELMHRLLPFSTLTQSEAADYVPEIGAVCDRMQRARTYIYLLKPQEKWDPHFFTADTLKTKSSVPGDQIASPRSNLVSIRLPPTASPSFSLDDRSESMGEVRLTVSLKNLPVQTVPGYPPGAIQMEILKKDGYAVPPFEPVSFEVFAQKGFKSNNPKMTATLNNGKIVIDYAGGVDGFLRLTASDPAGRGCKLDIR